jgi:hypothetical protein
MTKRQATSMIRRIKNNGGEARLYEGYSGRFMFGERTFGVVTSRWYLPKKIKYRIDNLGFDYIVY